MMGIKDDFNTNTETKPLSQRMKYIVVKNHVREIPTITAIIETSNESIEEEKKLKVKKKKSKKSRSSSESDNRPSEVSENDLNELRHVYNKCKAVITKMERKYGHLLQIDEECSIGNKHSLSSTECHCISKRKIYYDDDGEQVYQNVDAEHHVCPTSVQQPHKSSDHTPEIANVDIEHDTAYELPETIQELTEMLLEPGTSDYLKRQIINKMKNIRQDHLNTLRYEKPKLLKKLKSGSSDIFEFEGSNLSSLSGYPVDKVD